MDKLDLEKEDVLHDEEEEIIKSDIYDVMKILDRYKKEEALGKLYKAKFDYHRDGNSICLILSFNNLKKTDRLHNLFNSEFIQNLFNELAELNISNNFKKRIADKTMSSFSKSINQFFSR